MFEEMAKGYRYLNTEQCGKAISFAIRRGGKGGFVGKEKRFGNRWSTGLRVRYCHQSDRVR